ncbi:MAG TPA: glutaredoxin family protein [Usitatibacter sp.]|nr:glutaredoxin family protein [Usitatibacter sp.]
MAHRFLFAVAALAFAFAGAAWAQVYKWTDPSGKTHYGDRPPEGVAKQEVAIRVPSHEGPVEVTDWGAILRRKPAAAAAAPRASAGITMYSTDWCGHCRRAREYFAAHRIAFTEVDVEKSDSGRKDYEALGGRGVPLIVVGDKVMRGFSPQRFEALRK